MEHVVMPDISRSKHRVRDLLKQFDFEVDSLYSEIERLQGFVREYRGDAYDKHEQANQINLRNIICEGTIKQPEPLTKDAVTDRHFVDGHAETLMQLPHETPVRTPQRVHASGNESGSGRKVESQSNEYSNRTSTCQSSVKSIADTLVLARQQGALDDPDEVRRSLLSLMSEEDPLTSNRSELLKLMKCAANKFQASYTPEYSDHGVCAQIVKNSYFDHFIMAMVCANGLWIAIDTDLNTAGSLVDAEAIFQIMEFYFSIVFFAEVLIRFFAFKRKRLALFDTWFMFDAILVALMILETWIFTLWMAITSGRSRGSRINASMFRLLRLVKLTRLSRLIRFVPDLYIMVKGVLEATRSVFCTIALLVGVLYVFAIVLRQYSIETDMGYMYFSSVPHALFTLFFQGTLLDNIAELMMQIYEDSLVCFVVMLAVIVLSAFTLMNMLIGVICEVMNRVALKETENIAMKLVTEQIQACLKAIDKNQDGEISKDEFEKIITNRGAARALAAVGVDVVALLDFANYFFQSDKHGDRFDQKLSFDDFMAVVMQVRGFNPATVKDIVDLRKFIHNENTGRNKALMRLHDNQIRLAANQRSLETSLKDAILRLQSSEFRLGLRPLDQARSVLLEM